MPWSFVVAALVAALAAVPASAEETCHAFESQFAKERMCVSSVLAPQGASPGSGSRSSRFFRARAAAIRAWASF
jgi:hypothetical protein